MESVSEVLFGLILYAMAMRLGWLLSILAQQLFQKYVKGQTDES
ncbi:MAG: hypothetical protein U0Y68_27375 [Blastocatellia bacterium]